MTRIPERAAATMVAATVVPPNPGLIKAAARFHGETLTASFRSARAAHSSSVRPISRVPSKTATRAGVAPAFSQASHWRRTASMAARPAGAMVSALTAAMLRRYIQLYPAGVAELVQAHGLGPCGVSHEGSSPSARTNTKSPPGHQGGRVFGHRLVTVDRISATPSTSVAGHEDAERVPRRVSVDPQWFFRVIRAISKHPGAQS